MNDSGTDPSWCLAVARPARRALDRIPAKVSFAVIDFILGPLLDNPHRVGKRLREDWADLHSARVGAYRIVYEIDEDRRAVTVNYIEHRSDIYRPH